MDTSVVKAISVTQLKEMKESKEDFVLIDVREPDEEQICSLGGKLIPLGSIDKETEQIPTDKKVIVHCRSGKRSYMAIMFLQQEYGFTNLFNLDGGIVAYANQIDPEMVVY
jgi:sulfur-carrier protein adenylyltransferase/sulfurtransferase